MTDRPARAARPSATDATVVGLRQRTRAQVLTDVVLAGQTTRAEIAERTGLSLASVTKIVTDLVADGLVEETGQRSSGGGRPITLIAPRADGAYLIGADVGERGVAVELFDLRMTMIDREFRGGGSTEGPGLIARDLTEAIEALAARNAGVWPRVVGIGLALPGLVETEADGRQVLYAQSLGWPPVDVADLLRSDLPVLADNGAKAQARAELWFGAARGVDHAVVALLGRGVGLGLVVDGVVQRGSRSSAGEWGHSKIQPGGRLCRCGDRGCLEAYVGADAIFASWSAAGGVFTGSGWNALGQLLEAAESGDHIASAVVDDLVSILGASLGGLVNLTGPERLVVGGWVGLRLVESLGPRIEAEIRARSLARPGSQFDLRAASFGGDTVAIGAAVLPLERLIRG